jgi:ribosome-binding factor A
VLGSDEEKTGTAAALKSARSRIQSVLGRETRMRYTPVLEFKVDPSIDEGLRINQLLADLEEAEAQEDV